MFLIERYSFWFPRWKTTEGHSLICHLKVTILVLSWTKPWLLWLYKISHAKFEYHIIYIQKKYHTSSLLVKFLLLKYIDNERDSFGTVTLKRTKPYFTIQSSLVSQFQWFILILNFIKSLKIIWLMMFAKFAPIYIMTTPSYYVHSTIEWNWQIGRKGYDCQLTTNGEKGNKA